MKFSFVIPCYGSELTISDVISEIAQKMGEKSSFDYEIIAINDCSPDAVLGILKETAQKNPRVKVIDLSKMAESMPL